MLRETFSSLKHKNYRLFFIGQFFSLVGLWTQNVGQQWLVWDLTHSPFWVGVAGFLSTIPILFLSIFGGAIADRFSKLKLNFIIQFISMIQSLALWYLVYSGNAEFKFVAILIFTLGIINAFEIPIRQSFTIEMVGKDDLQNAIGLNSTVFNLARIIGPMVAGLVILYFGVEWCFFINSISFFSILITLLLMDKSKLNRIDNEKQNIKESILSATNYLKNNYPVLKILISVGIVTIFGWSYSVILPALSDEVFHQGAKGLSALYSANGFGALISAIFIASTAKKLAPEKIMIYSFWLFSLSAILLSISTNFTLSLVAIFVMGMGVIGFFVSANSNFQKHIPHNLRGRLLGFYVLIFQGLHPFGNLFIGSLSKIFNVQTALLFSIVICSLLFYRFQKD